MPTFEQGVMDSLHAALRALNHAIMHYEKCEGGQQLSFDGGHLFATLDFLNTVEDEIQCIRGIHHEEGI
jgi:hypothetical protein